MFYLYFRKAEPIYVFCGRIQSTSHERGHVNEGLCHDGSRFETDNQARNSSHSIRIIAGSLGSKSFAKESEFSDRSKAFSAAE
jgi:hypothetical protein